MNAPGSVYLLEAKCRGLPKFFLNFFSLKNSLHFKFMKSFVEQKTAVKRAKLRTTGLNLTSPSLLAVGCHCLHTVGRAVQAASRLPSPLCVHRPCGLWCQTFALENVRNGSTSIFGLIFQFPNFSSKLFLELAGFVVLRDCVSFCVLLCSSSGCC